MVVSATIAELLSERRYDPSIAPQLENYVNEQVKTGTYDLEANLALLRFYQYSPATATTKIPIVSKILMKALMALPETDYMLCTYLIPVSIQNDSSISSLKTLADHLESCSFQQFWTEAASCGALLGTVPGFEEAIRKFILGVVAATFQVITKEELSSILSLNGKSLDDLLTGRGWKVSGDEVRVPPNDMNQASQKAKQEDVSFEHLAPIVVATGQ